jgi:hypothetical protein
VKIEKPSPYFFWPFFGKVFFFCNPAENIEVLLCGLVDDGEGPVSRSQLEVYFFFCIFGTLDFIFAK